MVKKRIVSKGRVQGVSYRASVERFVQENQLAVVGHVRNLPDKSVEIKVAGKLDDILKIKQFCHMGPPMSQVESVEMFDLDEELSETNFRIKYT